LDLTDGYEDCSFETAASSFDELDEAIVIRAPNSRQASAVQKPIPEDPPMMRMREP
jgi:predicted small metal-binding protein